MRSFYWLRAVLSQLFCLAVILLSSTCFGQQPKVLAPHVPLAPKASQRQPFGTPIHQSAVGGLWMTGPNMKSALYLKNTLKTDPLTVTPSIYLANGVRYTFPPVTLEPSGTAVVDINQSLAQQGVASYAELYGYAEIEYQWPWAPVTATVRNVDAVNSLIFMYPLQQPPEAFPRHASTPTGQPAAYELEGLWWKQEKGVSGFIALANVTGQEVNADVHVTDNTDSQISSHQVTVSPHGTKIILLDELKTATGQIGGVYLSHDGDEHALAVSGGLRDPAVGYSARLPLLPPPQQPGTGGADQNSGAFTTAELGLMTGAADPMMNFPSGTVFTPYSIIRNISDQSVSVTPTIWWMAGGTAHLAQVPKFTVAPHRTMNLNVPNLLASAGLNKFSGSVNVVLDSVGEGGALAMASGSVDEKNTYVFEVMPHGIGESASKAMCYWSTGNGDDTMVTLWNPTDEAQDFAFTLFYAGGQYVYPVPLRPRETRAFNVSEILHSSIPDPTGNIIPAGITEGSAEIAGSLGEHQHILIGLDAAIYNVRKAICSPTCVTCNGITSTSVVISTFSVPVNGSQQQIFYEHWNTGNQYNMTNQSNWSSSATSVMTVNNSASKGAVIGVATGSATISAGDEYLEPIYEASYCTPGYPCPNGSQGGNTGGNVFSGVLTPQDNFSGRSSSRFGIAEVINLSFNAQTTAAALGGLQWSIVSGGGSLTNAGTAGTATYASPTTSATVVLRLAVVSGNSQGQHHDYSITIITPSGALESKFSNVRHTYGDISVGFLANAFLEPTDVSFANLLFAEGSAPAVASGYFAYLNGDLHTPTASPLPIGSCDSVIGCKVLTPSGGGDRIDTGDDPPQFSNGDFVWSIPWQYKAPGGALTTFTTVNHHATAVATSSTAATATIEKAGAGPFSKNSSDPTTTF